MGKTRVVFIDPGVKVNSSYYCNIVLEKGLLPDIRTIVVITSGHFINFIQRIPCNSCAVGATYIKMRKHNFGAEQVLL